MSNMMTLFLNYHKEISFIKREKFEYIGNIYKKFSLHKTLNNQSRLFFHVRMDNSKQGIAKNII